MAQILAVARGLRSLVYPTLELARRLRDDGHRVTFAGAPSDQALAAQLGLDFIALPADDLEAFLDSDRRERTLHRLRRLGARREAASRATGLTAFIDAVGSVRPDLVLVNGEMHEHIVGALALRLPVALLNTFVSIWRHSSIPPPHHLIVPGRGWKGHRAVALLLWLMLDARKRVRRLRARIRHVGCDRVSVLAHQARQWHVALEREVDTHQWLIPFTYRHLPVLSLHAQEFEFPHTPPARVHYVGPMVLEHRGDPAIPGIDAAALDAVLERRRLDGRRRLIFAAFGSTLTADLDFLRRLVAIIDDRPHWELVVSLSNRLPKSAIGRLPEGVHAFDWVPQLRVLAAADVMVTHGGINTIDECVLNGVPPLVYCGFETDMGGTTARVVHHGLGLAGEPGDDTATIRRRVDRLLDEPVFGAAIRRFGEHYRRYRDGKVAEHVVNRLIASGEQAKGREPIP
jgi:zeaxanthin glucosyltransferase